MLEMRFSFGDKVMIDGDPSISGIITAVQFRVTRDEIYEISYMHMGAAQAPWIEHWRLAVMKP